MSFKMKIIKKFKPFEWFMILAVIGFTIYFSVTNRENSLAYILIDAIAAISGIICVVLCAKGKKSQYFWGVINIVGYIIIAWMNRYYGEVMLNAFYYFPAQFIGYYLWNKNSGKNSEDVKSKKLNKKQAILILIICVVGIVGYKFILNILGGTRTYLDSATTIMSVCANLLMLLRYREQWLLWIVIDIITVIMWVIVSDYIMVTMWSVYLLNAFYGYYIWSKVMKEE